VQTALLSKISKHHLLEPENLYGFEVEEFLAVLPHLQGIK
jgi:hypothetical protein